MRGCELETGSAAPGQGLGDGRGAGDGPILPSTSGPLGRCGGSLLGHLSYAGVTLPSSLQCIVPMRGVGHTVQSVEGKPLWGPANSPGTWEAAQRERGPIPAASPLLRQLGKDTLSLH